MISRRRLLTATGGIVAAATTGATTACGSASVRSDPAALAGTVLDTPIVKAAEVLIDTHGNPFDLVADTKGQLTLLFFGYTSCPDVCPVHLAVLAGALRNVRGPARATKVIFVGVDTKRDTPAALEAYLAKFDPAFIGLTAAPEVLDRTQAALGLPAPLIEPPDSDGAYAVGHASQILAFTADDLCHVLYPFGIRRQQWEHDLPLLAANTWTGHPEGSAA